MIKNWLKGTTILFVLWLILSGHFTAKYIIIGLLASAMIAYFCLPMLWIWDKDHNKRYGILDVNFFSLCRYWIWLLFQIIKASLSVAKAVVSPRMKINPRIIEFQCGFENPIAITMLVNSIILTPGTVTVDVKDNKRFIVHALTDDAAEGLLEGKMQWHIGRLFHERTEASERKDNTHESII